MEAQKNTGVDWNLIRAPKCSSMMYCQECLTATYHTIDGCVSCKQYEEICNETMAPEKTCRR